MNEITPATSPSVENSRNQRLLLGALFSLSVSDGVLTRFIITHDLGSEGNSWLAKLADSDALIGVKIVGTLLAVALLWILHYRKPKLVLSVTIAAVCWYTLLVFWSLFIIIMGTR